MVQSTSPANQARAQPSLSACPSRSDRGNPMRLAAVFVVIAMAVSLGACLPGKQKTAKAAPAPPKPVAPAPPPAPPPNLSAPQTNVELPPPQPVPAEALAS